jgi:hypothetical protein
MVKDIKIVCSLDLLLQLIQTHCQTAGCVGELNNRLYVNNFQAAASSLLSGNNFGKIERLDNFYGFGIHIKEHILQVSMIIFNPRNQ